MFLWLVLCIHLCFGYQIENWDQLQTSTLDPHYTLVELSKLVQLIYTDPTNSVYYINVTVLNDNYSLLLDTASSISWINNRNNISINETLKDFQLFYTGQSVSGKLLETNIQWNQYQVSDNLGFTNSSLFQQYTNGVLSLSYNSNFINNLYNQNQQIDSKQFGFIFNDNSNSKYGGLMVLGSATQHFQTSVFNVTNRVTCSIEPNPNHYWLVNMTLTGNDTSALQAIVDTGTTGIVLPLQQANDLHSQLFGNNYITDNQGNYAFVCNYTAYFNLTINNSQFQINSIDFQGVEYKTKPGYCASKIQGILSSNYWILGQTFLKKYYTVFDLENSQIDFSAPQNKNYVLKPINDTFTTVLSTSPSTSKTPNKSTSSPTPKFNGSSNIAGLLSSLNICIALFVLFICICII